MKTRRLIAIVFILGAFGLGACSESAPEPSPGPAPSTSSDPPSSDPGPCEDPEFATSLSIPEEIEGKPNTGGPFLRSPADGTLYLISARRIFRRDENGWSFFKEFASEIKDAELSADGRSLFLSISGFDLVKINLTSGDSESLVTPALLAQDCPGFPKIYDISLDTTSGYLYAHCPNRLFLKKPDEDWEMILADQPAYGLIGFSKDAVPAVCVATGTGVLCRQGTGSWEKIADGDGVDSTMTSQTVTFSYRAGNNRLVAVFYSLPGTAERDCRVLTSWSLGAWENVVTKGNECHSSVSQNDSDLFLYLVKDDTCELQVDRGSSVTTLGTIGPLTFFSSLLTEPSAVCPSRPVIDSSEGVLYTPLYEERCHFADGYCPSPTDVIAICIR